MNCASAHSRKPGIALTIHGNARLAQEPIRKKSRLPRCRRAPTRTKESHRRRDRPPQKNPRRRRPRRRLQQCRSSASRLPPTHAQTHPSARLIEIATPLGADVPFFLFGGRALGVNKGDEIYPLDDVKKHSILVVAPQGIHVPTPEAFRWVNAPPLPSSLKPASQPLQRRQLTKSRSNSKLSEFCALCWSAQLAGLSNDFEAAVFRRHPRLASIKRELLQAGAAEAMLAGSGSAVFGVFPSPALARRAAVGFPSDQTFVCETISRDRYKRLVKTAL